MEETKLITNDLSHRWQSIFEFEKQLLKQNPLLNNLLEQNLLKALFLATSDNLILLCDRKGRILHCNQQFYRCGYEELLGTYIWDSIFPREENERVKFLDQVDNSSSFSINKKHHISDLVFPDGKHHRFNWTITTFSGESNYKSYHIMIGTDITEQWLMEESLQETKAELDSIFENVNGIIYTLSLDGEFIFISPGWSETMGYNIGETIGQSYTKFVHPDSITVCQKSLEEVIITDTPQKHVEYQVRHKDGSWRWHTSNCSIVRDENSSPKYYVGLASDITEKKMAEATLQRSEEKFSKAFNASPATMSITTMADGRFIDVNYSFCNIVGYHREEILGRTSKEMNFWYDAHQRHEVIVRLLNNESVRDLEMFFHRKYDEVRLGLYSAEQIDIDGVPCILSIVTDITERKKAEEDIRFLSFHDKLTGLYNRALVEEELKRLDTSHLLPLTIIMGDVNGLKMVNDALGHHEGDKLLMTVANIVRQFCRQEDIIGRWGGDEFLILLPECNVSAANKVLNRIKNACKRISELPLQTSMSLGIATKNSTEQNIQDVIKEAEDKMYRNKLLETRSARSTFIKSLEKTLWTRSHETKDHCQRMQKITKNIGQAIGLSDSEMDDLILLAALHDIGKIAIPNNILDKPAELSTDEWEVIKKHPETGYRIALSSPELLPIAEAILHHHERWDGTGYPLGLEGDNIPIMSRIIAIADTYDVMINGRPYQNAVTTRQAKEELARCAGSQFDPQLVKAALAIIKSVD